MAKRMVIMLASVALVFGGIFGFKVVQARMAQKYLSGGAPPATVTTVRAEMTAWQPRLKAVGTVRAFRGIDVTSEIAGLVREVAFRSGDRAEQGQVLVRLDDDADRAQLTALEAAADLARTTLERDRKQLAIQAVSQAVVDTEEIDLRIKSAQAAAQRALVEKKTIRAPFSGRLGITTVNPGQYLNPGDRIAPLQQLDPLYVDFTLPQQDLAQLKRGQAVTVETDALPQRRFGGTVTVIDPRVDPDTRNVKVEAVVRRSGGLLPGMYASVRIEAGKAGSYVTLPQTAITYNPYGDTVYLIEEKGADKDGKPLLAVRQSFVTLGPTRGDQIAILTGVKEGETVVTSGQLKLRNGSFVVVNNAVQPSNEPAPKPEDP